MAAGYQQRLCHLNGRGRCVPMKQNILNNLFEIPHVKSWFSGTYKVLNEAEIITPKGESYRPDRLMIKENQVIVIDYKFGQQKEEKYKRQVGNYLQLITQMGYQATGFIVYATLGEIESV